MKWKIVVTMAIVLTVLALALSACGPDIKDRPSTTDSTPEVAEGPITTESGLQYEVLEPGEGPAPEAGDVVSIHYSATLEDGTEVGSLGVYQARSLTEHGLAGAIPVAFGETWENLAMIVSVLKKMFTGHVSVQNLSGPISIAQIAGDSAEYGWRSYIGILAFLSLSLGIMNLLPIPILDGGHVVFNGVEWVTGKPVPERVQIVGVQVGLLLVGTTMLFAIYNDILRVF